MKEFKKERSILYSSEGAFMWDVPNIVNEMREIEKQDNTCIKHDKTPLDAPLKHDFFTNDDIIHYFL